MRDVRVDLRGGERRVAEYLLDATQVSAAFEQMRGGGMPQPVRAGIRYRPEPPRSWHGRSGVRSAGRCGRRGLPGTWLRAGLRASAGRPCASHSWTARSAGMPTGTVRSLFPLPRTRTVRRPVSRSCRSSPHSSLTLIPAAYSSSMIAVSRTNTAGSIAAAPRPTAGSALRVPRSSGPAPAPAAAACAPSASRAARPDRRPASRGGARTQ